VSPHDAGDCGWFKDTPVGSPRQCADFVGQWREELLASIWKRLPKVATEMALHVLVYNLTRAEKPLANVTRIFYN
jgi:hypothetical protein